MSGKPAWTNEEIVRHYNGAKDKAEIIDILAELNGVTANCICRILVSADIEPAARELSKKQRAQLKVMLIRDGNQYTVNEVARMHQCSRWNVRNKYRGKTVCRIGDAEYKVVSYNRRG